MFRLRNVSTMKLVNCEWAVARVYVAVPLDEGVWSPQGIVMMQPTTPTQVRNGTFPSPVPGIAVSHPPAMEATTENNDYK